MTFFFYLTHLVSRYSAELYYPFVYRLLIVTCYRSDTVVGGTLWEDVASKPK